MARSDVTKFFQQVFIIAKTFSVAILACNVRVREQVASSAGYRGLRCRTPQPRLARTAAGRLSILRRGGFFPALIVGSPRNGRCPACRSRLPKGTERRMSIKPATAVAPRAGPAVGFRISRGAAAHRPPPARTASPAKARPELPRSRTAPPRPARTRASGRPRSKSGAPNARLLERPQKAWFLSGARGYDAWRSRRLPQGTFRWTA